MEIVRNIFKSPINLRRDSSFSMDSPLGALEEHIKQLENINLSPLPTTKESMKNHQNEVSGILKKIIINFDIILMDKLKKNKSDVAVKGSASSQADSVESHYWIYLSKYFQIPSVKFINNIYEKLQKNSDKGLAWIYISISEKSFHENIQEIFNQAFDKKFYEAEAYVNKNKSEILFFSEKICKFHLFNIKSSVEDEYNDYKRQKEMEGKDNDRSDFDLPVMSPIKSLKKYDPNIAPFTPTTIEFKEMRDMKNNPNYYYSKATLDLNMSNLQSRNETNHIDRMNIKTIDNLFNLINKEDEENLLNNVDQPDEEDLEVIREKSYAKNTQIIYSNVHKETLGNNFNYNNYNAEEKVMSTMKMMIKPQNVENFNVCKYFDLQQCYKEDFYNNIFEGKANTYEKRDLTPKSVIKTSASTNNNNTIASYKKANFNLDNVPNQVHYHHIPFDKNFRICRKVDKNQFTKKDIIYYNNKEIKMTNSVVFYLNHFYKKELYIKFNTQITAEKPMTLESQNHQCQFCMKKFKTFLHIPLSKIYWCSYYMRYICQDCVSDEFSIVPAFILKNWDFRKFQISKQARDLFNQWYDKPVIHIKQKDPIIKQSSLLHAAILMKRKIHKIFDLMKCDNCDTFIMNTLGSYRHLVLRETLFSLKDCVDISEYRLINKLKEFYQKFEQHILKDCSVCNYKGGTCMMCMTDQIIYAYDVESVLYCNECKKLFHKKCCSFHPCIINR